jgi:hypothetical protein
MVPDNLHSGVVTISAWELRKEYRVGPSELVAEAAAGGREGRHAAGKICRDDGWVISGNDEGGFFDEEEGS